MLFFLKNHHIFLLLFFFFFTQRKNVLDGRPTHGIYRFAVDPRLVLPKSGSMTETRVAIGAVKNSIWEKIYTFSIAFLELTISKKNFFF